MYFYPDCPRFVTTQVIHQIDQSTRQPSPQIHPFKLSLLAKFWKCVRHGDVTLRHTKGINSDGFNLVMVQNDALWKCDSMACMIYELLFLKHDIGFDVILCPISNRRIKVLLKSIEGNRFTVQTND